MIPTAYAVPTERSSPLWCAAFAEGCGGQVITCDRHRAHLEPGPVALFGSAKIWPLLQLAQAEGRTWYYGDHRYLGPVFSRFRITRNNYQVDGSGPPDYGRLRQLGIRARPWRKNGRHILICLQGTAQYELMGTSLAEWLSGTLKGLEAATDRLIRVRSRRESKPLALDLVNCWAVVTWSSNAAVDALVAGVPVFVTAPFAAAYSMGPARDLCHIDTPLYPDDRDRWLASLAANQWTIDEMRAGRAWRALDAQAVPA